MHDANILTRKALVNRASVWYVRKNAYKSCEWGENVGTVIQPCIYSDCGAEAVRPGPKCYRCYMRDYMNERRAKLDKRGRRDIDLRRNYHITIDQYEALLSAQGGQCKICGSSDPGANGVFEVDHDHACCDKKGSCGQCVRGLLCTNCNTGISRFKDDPKLLRAAADYMDAGEKPFANP